MGDPVEPRDDVGTPHRHRYHGRFVDLAPVNLDEDAAELYPQSHGTPETERLWTYMGYGPFRSEADMRDWLEGCRESADPVFLTASSQALGRRIGVVSFLNIVPAMRRLELGHIWYVPAAQRTNINTETVYLMLCETFNTLRYRRCEWKCDALNLPSRTAALRLGFSFEGVFKHHLITKGRNRDTAWFAMTDDEWPQVRTNLERWLYEGTTSSLAKLNAKGLRTNIIEQP